MRDIEFKVFVRDKNKIFNVKTIDFSSKFITFEEDNKPTDTMRMFDQVELMQYTGLKDKNGRKIFEGDIVNAQYFFENYAPYTLGAFEDEGEITGKIIFDLDGFRIVDKDDEGREVGLSMIEDSEVQMEVIGNIWDKPELLEKNL